MEREHLVFFQNTWTFRYSNILNFQIIPHLRGVLQLLLLLEKVKAILTFCTSHCISGGGTREGYTCNMFLSRNGTLIKILMTLSFDSVNCGSCGWVQLLNAAAAFLFLLLVAGF